MIPDWLILRISLGEIVIGGATLALAFVAAFQEWIRYRLAQPKLAIRSDLSYLKTPMSIPPYAEPDSVDSHYFRLWVENRGDYRAESVQIFAKELSRLQIDGSYERVKSFSPMNLVWSYMKKPYLHIPPGVARLCDLGHIVDPERGQRLEKTSRVLMRRRQSLPWSWRVRHLPRATSFLPASIG